MKSNIKCIPKGKKYKDMPNMNYKVITKDGEAFIPKLLPFSVASEMTLTIANLIPADALLNGV